MNFALTKYQRNYVSLFVSFVFLCNFVWVLFFFLVNNTQAQEESRNLGPNAL